MITKGVRLYGKDDLRLEEFELPEIQEDEILARVVSNSICMSSFKAAEQGGDHKRVPDDVENKPVLIGHEFCGEIIEVGKTWTDRFNPGKKFSIQPALNYKGSLDAPGYSFQYCGGNATFIILPREVMACNCLLEYDGEGYFPASLSEPMSCIVGAFHANYHTTPGSYVHEMGICEGGAMALLAGAGPMGLGAIDYAIHNDCRPGLLVVTDIDQARLDRAREIHSIEEAKKMGVQLAYVNTDQVEDPNAYMMSLNDGKGFDDVYVFAPVRPVVESGDRILGRDGCLNFFAGPHSDKFEAAINFYNVHYSATHVVGTTGGNTDDMRESLDLMAQKTINPATMVTHVGGLDSVVDTVLHLPDVPGGKKLIYTNLQLPLVPIKEFETRGYGNPIFKKLAEITEKHNGLWSVEAEEYLLANGEAV